MKKQKIKKFFYNLTEKKQIICTLAIIFVGVFLLPKIAYMASITEENIIIHTNKERIKNGVDVLTANQLLTKAAYDKGMDLMKAQKFQHDLDGKKFSIWIKDAGYIYSYAGENLAIDFITTEGVVQAWLDSPTHRKNLLNDVFEEIGVAVINDNFEGQETTLVVQIFGTQLNKEVYQGTTKNKTDIPNLLNNNSPLSIKNSTDNFPQEFLLTYTTDKKINNPIRKKYVLGNWDMNLLSKNLKSNILILLMENILIIATSFLLFHPKKIHH